MGQIKPPLRKVMFWWLGVGGGGGPLPPLSPPKNTGGGGSSHMRKHKCFLLCEEYIRFFASPLQTTPQIGLVLVVVVHEWGGGGVGLKDLDKLVRS